MNNDEYEDEYDLHGNDDENEYYDENDNQNVPNQHHHQHTQHQQQHQQQQHSQQQQQQYRSFSGGVGGNGAHQGFQHYQRLRRDLPNFNDLELQNRLSCNRSRCALIRCTTTQLDKDSSAWIALRMRLVTQTLNLVSVIIVYDKSF